jgi:hypothetical protein
MNIGTATVIKKVLNPTKLVLFRQEKIKKGSRRSEIDFPDVHLSLSEGSSSIDETTSVKKSLLGTSGLSLLLWLFVDLWGLTLNLTSTS